MTSCKHFQQELAACAAEMRSPDRLIAHHLRECPECRMVFAELQRVAASQHRAAGALPIAPRKIDFASWFLRQQLAPRAPRLFSTRQVRLATAGIALTAMTILATLLALVGNRREATSPGVQVQIEEANALGSPVPSVGRVPAAPTWQAFRDELKSERWAGEPLPGSSGFHTAQYRVKDAYEVPD